jgi:phosphohistidine phosphatase
MNLYLMRHGLAVEQGKSSRETDRKRPLTPKGKRKVRLVAQALAQLKISFVAIVSSPLVRARDTAELVKDELGFGEKIQLTDHLAPQGSHKALVSLLQRLPGSPQEILLVGHEPDLSQLAAFLLDGGKGVTLIFKKSGMAKLNAEKLRPGRCATLEWLLPPRFMERMA